MEITEQIQWLQTVQDGRWARLAAVQASGIPVPNGFVVGRATPEKAIRLAYDELKIREHTHFVAVRGPSHAVIEVLGNDRVMHTLRALWTEDAHAEILIQTMINASWCGKTSWEGKNLRIRASAGLQCLDPDMYLFNTTTRRCTRRTLYQNPRKVFRAVDGTTRTMEIRDERRPLDTRAMDEIGTVAKRVESDITWVMDDRSVWVVSAG